MKISSCKQFLAAIFKLDDQSKSASLAPSNFSRNSGSLRIPNKVGRTWGVVQARQGRQMMATRLQQFDRAMAQIPKLSVNQINELVAMAKKLDRESGEGRTQELRLLKAIQDAFPVQMEIVRERYPIGHDQAQVIAKNQEVLMQIKSCNMGLAFSPFTDKDAMKIRAEYLRANVKPGLPVEIEARRQALYPNQHDPN